MCRRMFPLVDTSPDRLFVSRHPHLCNPPFPPSFFTFPIILTAPTTHDSITILLTHLNIDRQDPHPASYKYNFPPKGAEAPPDCSSNSSSSSNSSRSGWNSHRGRSHRAQPANPGWADSPADVAGAPAAGYRPRLYKRWRGTTCKSC